ncbi:MAG: sigma-70 family RNA polymerase sigma factor [bacterium]
MYLLVANILGQDPRPPAAPDEELVQRLVDGARQGDSLAAQRLYRMFVRRVYRTVRPLAGTDADAEDIVQDTFVKALGSLGRYQRRADKRFVAYLLTIALNTARKQLRRGSRWIPLSPERADSLLERTSVGSRDDSPGAALERKRLQEALLEALATLPERDRRILVLRYGAELTAVEVGELCGESPESVRKICQRQRERLLAMLATPVPVAGAERNTAENVL